MSNSFAPPDNVANAHCSVGENVPGYTLQQAESGAVSPVLYTKCQILIPFLGIYCENMNHDASLWYSCGCSVLSPQDLRGVDFIWFSTSVSEWEPHELRREGSQESEWAALCVAVLVCLYSFQGAGVCRSEPLRGTLSWNCPHVLKFPLKQEVWDDAQEPVWLQTSGALGRNVARILEHWHACFLTLHL